MDIRNELERKRRVLTAAIQSGMDRTRGGAADRNEIAKELTKDPYGSASLIHDDEIVADMMDRRIRELQQVNRALEELAVHLEADRGDLTALFRAEEIPCPADLQIHGGDAEP